MQSNVANERAQKRKRKKQLKKDKLGGALKRKDTLHIPCHSFSALFFLSQLVGQFFCILFSFCVFPIFVIFIFRL